jgi:threonine dehydratase
VSSSVAAAAPTLAEIGAARTALGDSVRTTPLWEWQSGRLRPKQPDGSTLLLKLELFQHTGSFKVRGALTVMRSLSPEQLHKGVTAVSAGNHAIAVAYAARTLGTTAKVAMPATANPARVQACEALGAEVALLPDVHEAFAEAERLQQDEGRFLVHPFEGPLTALGTATLGLELCQQAAGLGGLDAVVVPIGGGGLCAGVAAAVKQILPDCRVLGVEPIGADTMHRSFTAGSPQSIDQVATIADSLGAPYALPYSFGLCRQFVDSICRVTDDELCQAMAWMFAEAKLAVEPAGAAATAAVLGPLRQDLAGKRVGLIVCGANLDAESFHRFVQRGWKALSG